MSAAPDWQPSWLCIIPARGGSVGIPRKKATHHRNPDLDIVAEFWSRATIGADDACWLWTGRLDPDGYGRFDVPDGPQVLAHRLAWELTHGRPCPSDTLDHTCRTHACVNPRHLDPTTRGENVRRSPGLVGQAWGALQRAKTHCPQDHEYTEANTYVETQANGRPRRSCRTCNRDRARRRRERSRS